MRDGRTVKMRGFGEMVSRGGQILAAQLYERFRHFIVRLVQSVSALHTHSIERENGRKSRGAT